MEFALDLAQIMTRNNYLLAVRDDFQSILVKPVLNLTERKLDQEPIDSYVRNRVFGAIVECVQNICRNDQQGSKKNGVLLLSKSDNYFVINAGNLVDSQTQKNWLIQLDNWMNSDRDSLKKELLTLKKSTTELDRSSLEKMALLDLIIKSDKNISYTASPVDDLFLLELEIKIAIC